MTGSEIRQARLDDTQAISALFRSRIDTWQRLNAQGQVEDLPYEALTIYERWLHGSHYDAAWMTVETGAIFLSHLLRGGGIPIVAVTEDGQVMAYAEAYPNHEPKPYGDHLHLAHLVAHPDHLRLRDELIRYLAEQITVMMDCRYLTVSLPDYDTENHAFYQRYRLTQLQRVRRYTVSAQTGQGFYKAVDHLDPTSEQIHGWYMTIGRLGSATQHWEALWPRLFDAIPEIVVRQTHRLRFTVAGQDSFICCQQHLYNPRSAAVTCWSPKLLSSQVLVAVRDWAHREGYRSLVLPLDDEAAKILASATEVEPYYHEIYSLHL